MITAHRLVPFVVVLAIAAWAFADAASAQFRGTNVQITQNAVDDKTPAMSADGNVVVWWRTNQGANDLYVAFGPNYAPTVLAPNATALALWPVVSGDGSAAAYVANGEVFVVPTGGGMPNQVTSLQGGPFLFTRLTITDDGGKVCLVAPVNGIDQALVVDTATKAVTNITQHTASEIVAAAISGDGNTVAFSAKRGGANEAIWVWRNGNVTKVLDIAPALPEAFSLDRVGRLLAFETSVSGDTRVSVVNTAGGSSVDLSQNPNGADRGPRMASNGERVAWKSARTNQNTQADVYLDFPEGTVAKAVTAVGDMNPSIVNNAIDIDGDGTRVIFSTRANLLNNPEMDGDVYLWTDSLSQVGTATPGGTVSLVINEPTAAGRAYLLRSAFNRTPTINLPGVGAVPLAADPLFFLSGQLPTVFQNYAGTLSATGTGGGAVAIPNTASLIGVDFYSAFVAVGPSIEISNSVKTEIR